MPLKVKAAVFRDRLVWVGEKGWPAAAKARGQKSRAKAPRSSCTGSMSTTTAPAMGVGENRISPRSGARARR